MPKVKPLPEYTTDQIVELIRQHIHNRVDRRLLFLRLVDGCTFEKITQIIEDEEDISFEVKTVRTRIHKGESILFRHIPG